MTMGSNVEEKDPQVFWLVILIILFSALHLVLFLPTPIAIGGALIVTGGLWLLWKLKWVILAVVGLEEMFGGRPSDEL